jgi:predicted glycosyltransferase involved in capsule biosynthesis
MLDVSIIIPFQTDHGIRADEFEWIKKYYSRVMPEAELCFGIINGKELNKSKAVNLAAKKATKEVLVIADADVIYDPEIIVKSISLLNKAACVVPFTEVYNIERTATERLLKTEPKWPIDVKFEESTKKSIYPGFAGKLIVISKEIFEKVGGFDERFIGWGGEDDAFSLAVKTICGKLVNIKGEIYHLWHPVSNYYSNPHGKENHALVTRYFRASGNKEQMVNLINERNII